MIGREVSTPGARRPRWRTGLWLAAMLALSASHCLRFEPGMHLDLRADDWRIHFEDQSSYASPAFDDSDWDTIAVPENWTRHFADTGTAWYRRTVVLTPAQLAANGPLGLYVETLLDSDETFWNGERIGATGDVDDYRSHAYGLPRSYLIPAKLLQAGPNVLAIRVRGYFETDAGIRSGQIYLDDPVAIESRLVLYEQLQLLLAGAFLVMAISFAGSCVYARGRPARAWFACGAAGASLYQFWSTPLAWDWLLASAEILTDWLSDPFSFRIGILFMAYYVLGASGVAFWTTYLRGRTTPVHVIYYSFTLLMASGCLISNDLILWNTLFDVWFVASVPALLMIILSLVWGRRLAQVGDRARRLFVAVGALTLGSVHDWLLANGQLSYPGVVPLLPAVLLVYFGVLAWQLARDFQQQNERSDAEFQRLWALRTRNQRFLGRLLLELEQPAERMVDHLTADAAPQSGRKSFYTDLSGTSQRALQGLERAEYSTHTTDSPESFRFD